MSRRLLTTKVQGVINTWEIYRRSPEQGVCHKMQSTLNYSKINCNTAVSHLICVVFDSLLGQIVKSKSWMYDLPFVALQPSCAPYFPPVFAHFLSPVALILCQKSRDPNSLFHTVTLNRSQPLHELHLEITFVLCWTFNRQQQLLHLNTCCSKACISKNHQCFIFVRSKYVDTSFVMFVSAFAFHTFFFCLFEMACILHSCWNFVCKLGNKLVYVHFVQVSLWWHHGHLKLLPLRVSTALVTFCNMILLSCLLTCSWAVGGKKTKERPQRKHFLFPRQLHLSPGLKQNPLLRINRTWARNFRGKDVTQGHISGIVGTINQ